MKTSLRFGEYAPIGAPDLQPQIGRRRFLLRVGLAVGDQFGQQLFFLRIERFLLRAFLHEALVRFDVFRGGGGELRIAKWHVDIVDLNGVKEGLQTVEVALRNGVVFVVVTAGTPDAEAQEDRTGGRGHFAQVIGAHFVRHQIRPVPRCDSQKAQRNVPLHIGGVVVAALRLLVGTGQLIVDKAVIGLVVVEGVDHPVAIAPGIADGPVAFEPRRLAVANQVEPMASPTLSIARIGQQTVDQLGVGIGCRIV